jgi:hypothetical protein
MIVSNVSQLSTSQCSVGKATRSNQKPWPNEDLQVSTMRINHKLGHVLIGKQRHVCATFKLGKR